MSAERIDFYFDVVCPYAYLASTRVEALGQRLGLPVRWCPVLLGGLFQHAGAPADPNETRSAPRAALDRADILRWADLWGVPLNFPDAHPRRTVDAMRALIACEESRRPALARSLFEAYWVHGQDVTDRDVIASIAGPHGIECSGDAAPWRREEIRQGLREATAAAAEAGVFGVPTFIAGEHFTWGQDRLGLVERWLAPGGDDIDPSRWCQPASLSKPPSSRRVRFLHDFSSPFSYLAATQIERVVARHGCELELCPILLGALFRDLGNSDVPLFAMHPAKQAWVRRDLEQWAEAWGVPFVFPSHFPMRTVLPLRVALVEPAATGAMYRAAWGHDRRIDEPKVLAEVLDGAGFDGAALVEGAGATPIKQALRDNTSHALQVGACGVPTVEIVSDDAPPILLWGQDRLVMVDAVLRGWTPPGAPPSSRSSTTSSRSSPRRPGLRTAHTTR